MQNNVAHFVGKGKSVTAKLLVVEELIDHDIPQITPRVGVNVKVDQSRNRNDINPHPDVYDAFDGDGYFVVWIIFS
jgi:hypothetical protein